jgi:hypothetical protein
LLARPLLRIRRGRQWRTKGSWSRGIRRRRSIFGTGRRMLRKIATRGGLKGWKFFGGAKEHRLDGG